MPDIPDEAVEALAKIDPPFHMTAAEQEAWAEYAEANRLRRTRIAMVEGVPFNECA
jgi:hypothetical protein